MATMAVLATAAALLVVVAPYGQVPAHAAQAADASSAGTEAAALQIAQAYNHDVTADDDTTQTSTTDVTPDGSLDVTQWAQPVRVKNAVGTWVDVDDTLEVAADGTLTPTASPAAVRFSGGGAGPLAVVTTSAGSAVSLSWPEGALPAPTLDGSSAVYPEVLPGVDLRLTATVTGMSELLVVKNAAAAANPDLTSVDFTVDGAVLAARAGGTVSATAANGEVVLSPAPTAWDSDGGGDATGPGGFGSASPVASTVSGDTETVDAASVANAGGVQFPVYVDPDFSVAQVNRTFTDNAYPNVAYWNGAGASDAYQHVGYINAANSDDGQDHVTRSYWQMPTGKYADRYIESAKMNTSLVWSSSCTAKNVSLYATSAISSATTWNNQPAASSYVLQDTQAYAAGYSSSCVATTVSFNALNALRTAADNSQPYVYLMLQANEQDWLAWKKFGANVAIEVRYHTRPSFSGTFDSSCTRTPGLLLRDHLNPGEVRYSAGGAYFLSMNPDGNLVLYKAANGSTPRTAPWSSQTSGNAGAWLSFQDDGNLVIRRPSDGAAIWQSSTDGTGARYLDVQDDGNTVLYDPYGRAQWHTPTTQPDSGIAVVCYSNKNTDHRFSAIATDNGITDSGGNTPTENLTYNMEIKYGSQDYTEPMGTQASGNAASYTFADFHTNQGYDWRVQACVYNTTACTTSGWKRTYEYFIAGGPTAPSVSVSGPVSHVRDDGFTGRVGNDQDVVTLTPSTATTASTTRPYGYLYGVFRGADAPGTSNGAPANNVGCGNPSSTAGYTMQCSSDGDQIAAGPIDIPIAAVDTTSQATFFAFDVYGNISSNPSYVNLFASKDTAAVQAGHSWSTDAADGPAGASCPHDAVTDTAASTSAPAPLLLTGAACRLATSSIVTGDPNGGVPPIDLHLNPNAENTGAGSTHTASVSGTVVDTGANATFTVGAWLYPTAASSAVVGTALAGRGSHLGRFYLQNAHGQWRFCMPALDADASPLTCAISSTAVTAKEWVFVVGTFDAINDQLRIYVSSNGAMQTPDVSLYRSAMPTSQPTALDVGDNLVSGGTMGGFWRGEITQPFVVQTALAATQFTDLGHDHHAPSAP